MADRSRSEGWLRQLANLPTASGLEHAVMEWVRVWASRRPDLRLIEDSGGNLLITQKGRKMHDPVLAVAHMDHPAFVVTAVDGRTAEFEFRGGVRPEYFEEARVDFLTGTRLSGRVLSYDPASRTGTIRVSGIGLEPAAIGRWRFAGPQHRSGSVLAPGCDDLAGVAAALSALDRARRQPRLRHLGVLLTRAEEMGFIGALHAAKTGSIPTGARLLSIEASRASQQAPIGGGPVIRVGDASTVFDQDLTNRISRSAARSRLPHQRKLMAGGACEATAFGAFGYRAAGLCLPLGNYHNMGELDAVEKGEVPARPMLEEVSLADYHGLVDLLIDAVDAIDGGWDLPGHLDSVYEESKHLLA